MGPTKKNKLIDMIRVIPDHPKEGVLFYDVTTLFQNPEGLEMVVDYALSRVPSDTKLIAGVESRGFAFASPVAYVCDKGLVLVRKKGKLPYETISVGYDLEYGTDVLEVHKDALSPGDKVVIIDDLLATGGTALATLSLIKQLGGEVAYSLFIVEIEGLGGREKLEELGVEVDAILQVSE